jgi:hypothetical protein
MSPIVLRVGCGILGLLLALVATVSLFGSTGDLAGVNLFAIRALSVIQLIGAILCLRVAFGFTRFGSRIEPPEEK